MKSKGGTTVPETIDPTKSKVFTKTLPQIIQEFDDNNDAFAQRMKALEDAIARANKATDAAKKAASDAEETAEATAKKLVDQMRNDYDAKLKELEGRINEHDTRMFSAGTAMAGPPKK